MHTVNFFSLSQALVRYQVIHLNALEKIIEIRGGINGAAMPKVLTVHLPTSTIFVHDRCPKLDRQEYMCSNLTFARFTQIYCNAFFHAPFFFFANSVGRTLERKLIEHQSLPISDNLLPFFSNLHMLADNTVDFHLEATTRSMKFMAFTRMSNSLDHRALTVLASSEHHGKSHGSTLVGCCQATLMLTQMTIGTSIRPVGLFQCSIPI